jgi:hypothetical protein
VGVGASVFESTGMYPLNSNRVPNISSTFLTPSNLQRVRRQHLSDFCTLCFRNHHSNCPAGPSTSNLNTIMFFW